MAIQVTGNLNKPYTVGAFYANPTLLLNPTLGYRNQLQLNVSLVQSGSMSNNPNIAYLTMGTVYENIYYQIDPASLEYPETPVDPYADMIYALETHVINDLTNTNPSCSFTRF
jgi:hypothetical protein